jgi:SulP family sulfate permease
VVALPLALAFAIASGVPPRSGLSCAIVAGFLISALGGSSTQIGGPTGAFVVVVAGIVDKYGIDGLYMCTMMAGVLLVALGVTGLGNAVRFLPRPVVIGFTNGIAVIIFSTQIKDFFGIQVEHVPGDFIGRISALWNHIGEFSAAATALSTFCLLLIITVTVKSRKIPGSIIAVFFGTFLAWLLHLPVDTIESRFGSIPQELPHITLPTFQPALVLKLLAPAITVAMLGAIESLLSAVVADNMSNDKHNPNVELTAQGIANIMSPLVGGLPATGAIARTATNIRSGAATPVAGMVHALTLLVILLVAAPLAGMIPLPVLAAVLFVVSYNMGEWKEVPEIIRLGKSSVSVWFITFALTVFADLTVAVEAGIIMAALLYIQNVTQTTTVAEVTPEYVEDGLNHSLQCNPIPKGVIVFRIHGPFLFGATDKLSIIEQRISTLPPVVILRLRNMNAIDATGLHALETLAEHLKTSGRQLLFCGMRDQPAKIMKKADFRKIVGEENFLPSLRHAIERVNQLPMADNPSVRLKNAERPPVA